MSTSEYKTTVESEDEQYYLANDDTDSASVGGVTFPAKGRCTGTCGKCSSVGAEESGDLPADVKPYTSYEPQAHDSNAVTDMVTGLMGDMTVSDSPSDVSECAVKATVSPSELTDDEKEARRKAALELKEKGNTHFRQQEYEDAARVYGKAMTLCPLTYSAESAVLLANRAACFAHLDRHEEAVADCSEALKLNPLYTKALLRRAELYEKKQKYEEAMEDYKSALQTTSRTSPAGQQACDAIERLPALIAKRNEELKTEMLGKLKDLGNMVLRPFGLSTNNFQVVQNPATGAYSINFQQNAPQSNSS